MTNTRPIPQVIALNAPSPEHGKTTVAKYAAQHYGLKRISFADPIRAMLRTLYLQVGISEAKIKYYMHDKVGKEQIIPEFGKSYRYMARTLGTLWGRDLINVDMWTNIALIKIQALLKVNPRQVIIIDDCRFITEAKSLRDNFITELWRVVNNRIIIPAKPAIAEGELNNAKFDAIINNNGSLDELYVAIHRFMDQALGFTTKVKIKPSGGLSIY